MTKEEVIQFAYKHGCTVTFAYNIDLYWKLCKENNINPIIAISQYAKGTNWGRFGYLLNASYKNPCGLKSKENPYEEIKFSSWEDGIKANIEKLIKENDK